MLKKNLIINFIFFMFSLLTAACYANLNADPCNSLPGTWTMLDKQGNINYTFTVTIHQNFQNK